MKTRILGLAGMALGLAMAWAAPASAGTVTLPLGTSTCGTAPGTNCLVFDQFTVFSLALLNYQAGFGDINGNDPYAVDTNGTALDKALVVGTGSGGHQDNTDLGLPAGTVDNAYATPNTAPGSPITNFATKQGVPNVQNSTEGTQGGSIPGNTSNTWDITTSSLKTYLNGGELVFFFNLNQTNSGSTTYLNNVEDALGWLSVTLRNNDGSVSTTIYLDGDACTGTAPPSNDPICPSGEKYTPNQNVGDNNNSNILTDQPANHNDWAYIHGEICVGKTGTALAGAVLGFGSCGANGVSSADGDTVNQNLGAGLAAFALFSQQLNDLLYGANSPYTVMSVDFRMAALNNGFENLLIFSSNAIPQQVPEPLTITLFGAGLAGLGLLRRRRRKA